VRVTNGYVYPASHSAGSTACALPMGARLRLKSSKNISGYAMPVRKNFQTMKTSAWSSQTTARICISRAPTTPPSARLSDCESRPEFRRRRPLAAGLTAPLPEIPVHVDHDDHRCGDAAYEGSASPNGVYEATYSRRSR
jgi:hypothetical protein